MFKKFVLLALVAALGVAALPFSSVSAAGLTDETTPPKNTEMANEKLERSWERATRINERVGKIFEQADMVIEKIQARIDEENEAGADTSAVQAALDVFKVTVEEARPIYESAQDVIAAHEGFDDEGKVTDSEKAVETLKSLGESLREIREITGDSRKTLREAIKAFREANPRPERPDAEKPTTNS